MANRMRRVSLLGAFEISPELEPPVRDGIILGSRREQRGFVLEASRESIEQIVTASTPGVVNGCHQRLTIAIGGLLERLGNVLLRIELRPIQPINGKSLNGSYVQGILVIRDNNRRIQRLNMTATEAIQVAIAQQLPILADAELLQLDVSQFLSEIDEFSERYQQESSEFKAFVDHVTATDFTRYLKRRGRKPGDSPEDH
ncbi:MAG: hypothetical protein HY692_08550 [Cyanobacteria bacterium NC_groundwater_1444_Ag_S-0.65um_54_12]|nr:hypothetical protein [Cyanobacteria bacterium NC_groundwater_1444_Ag_S-0.65um_54_12]